MTTLNKLYDYIYTVNLVFMDDSMTAIREDNVPMNNLRPIKVFKGVDNTVRFRVFDPDRKPINVGTGECDYLAKIFDAQTNEHIIDRYLTFDTSTEIISIGTAVDPSSGTLPASVPPGTYTVLINTTTGGSADAGSTVTAVRPATVTVTVGNCVVQSIEMTDLGEYTSDTGGGPNGSDIATDISIALTGVSNGNGGGTVDPDDLGVEFTITTQSASSLGFLNLTLTEGDLINFLPCYYNISIVCEETAAPRIRRPLYTDMADNVCQQLLVEDCVFPDPRPTQEVTSFTLSSGVWTSSRLSGGRRWNTISSLHSIAIYTTDFTGIVRVQASLDNDVPSEDSWFDVDLTTLDDFVTFNNESGIHFATFYANVRRIRFQYEEDDANTGTVDRILLRN